MPGPRRIGKAARATSPAAPRQEAQRKEVRRKEARASAALRGKPGSSSAVIEEFLNLIEGEVIPRLVMAYRLRRLDQDPGEVKGATVGDVEVERLTELTLEAGYESCFAYVMRLRRLGVESDKLLLHLLAPVARRLGELWESDESDFVSVTVGLGHLQMIMRELGRMSPPPAVAPGNDRRALLATVPGEQHTFGLLIVEDHLRRAGWDVQSALAVDAERELVRRVKKQWFAAVGLSMSDSRWGDSARSAILAIRKASRNRGLFVMVGGLAFQKDPGLAGAIGADAAASDAPEALRFIEKHLAALEPVQYQDAAANQMRTQYN